MSLHMGRVRVTGRGRGMGRGRGRNTATTFWSLERNQPHDGIEHLLSVGERLDEQDAAHGDAGHP